MGPSRDLGGVLPVLPTIFDPTGAVDEADMRRVVDYAIAAGAHGVVFPGIASEHDMLDADERLRLTALVGEAVAGRAAFVVGASAATADEATRYAIAGAEAGASAAMILTPRQFADAPAAMAGFFAAAHAASGIPIMLQNAPPPTGLGMSLDDVAAIARAVDGIRYVKEEAPPSGQRITGLTERTGSALAAVFGGAGARHVIDELARGARGTMPASEITELHVAMFERFASGDEAGARNLFERTLPLLNMQAVFRWRLTKAVLQRRGLIDCAAVRAAGPELDRHDRAELDALLDRLADLLPLEPVPA